MSDQKEWKPCLDHLILIRSPWNRRMHTGAPCPVCELETAELRIAELTEANAAWKALVEKREADNERSLQRLECMGIPRQRGKTVSGGLDVLDSRLAKEAHSYAFIEAENERLRAVYEAAKLMNAVLWSEDDHFDGDPNIEHYAVQMQKALAAVEGSENPQ